MNGIKDKVFSGKHCRFCTAKPFCRFWSLDSKCPYSRLYLRKEGLNYRWGCSNLLLDPPPFLLTLLLVQDLARKHRARLYDATHIEEILKKDTYPLFFSLVPLPQPAKEYPDPALPRALPPYEDVRVRHPKQ